VNYNPVTSVACVVEGHGERTAIPILVKRVAQALGLAVTVPPAIRDKRSRLITEDGLRRAVGLAAVSVNAPRRVLVVLDADGDCPAQLGPRMQTWAQDARPDVPCAVIVAKQEYEAWLIAGASGLGGQRGLPAVFQGPPDPEDILGAKEWVSRHMPQGLSLIHI